MRAPILPSCYVLLLLLLWQASGIGAPTAPANEDLERLKKAGIRNEPQELLAHLRQRIRTPATGEVEVTAAVLRVLAVQPAPETATVLLELVEAARDPRLREEACTAVGRVAIRKGSADPVLLNAFKHGGEQQKAAIYALARRGAAEYRALLRPLLEDKDAVLRDFTMVCLSGLNPFQPPEKNDQQVRSDENLLRDFKVIPDEKGLLEFFRQRTVTGNDEQKIRGWLRQLGDPSHRVREQASRQLLLKGPPVVKFLEGVLSHSDQEVAQRARLCLERIAQGAGPALPMAAVRLLPGRVPSTVLTRALLDYIPFADDLQIEDEALQSLWLATLRATRLDSQLTAALKDAHPLRRAAAAYVLGKAGFSEDCKAVQPLLRDADPVVRLRAAQGLLAARDPQAVPELIALLETLPQARVHALEEPLFTLAGENTPALPPNLKGDVGKVQAALWRTWWGKHGSEIDLAALGDEERRLGLFLISEYDSVKGRPLGRIFEMARDGKERWEVGNLQGPMSVQSLPGGRVLIAENMGMKVSERDLQGKVHWEHRTQTFPIQATRLPGGNTFIATYHELYELTPGGKQVYKHDFGRATYIFSAERTRNGRIVYLTSMGVLREIEAVSGKEIRTLNLGHNGWASVESLPGGRYLVALMNPGVVREIDSSGKTLWSVNFPGVFRATRLPGGNIVAASMTTRRVAEYDRNQQMRWEKICDGRPWCILYR